MATRPKLIAAGVNFNTAPLPAELPVPDRATESVSTPVIGKVSAQLSPGANWLVSEFQEPPSGVRHLHARLWLFAMYGFFSMTTGLSATKLPPYRDMLQRRGLAEIDHRERRFGLIRSQVWCKRSNKERGE